jgi:hypothetical protein
MNFGLGQPSLSGGPGWSGHLSRRSTTVSPSRILVGAAGVLLRSRLDRALVVGVGDAVLVVVQIGAAVLVLEPVLVLGLHRALVGLVEEPVVVIVGIGAAVLVLEAVLVLGIVGAGVDLVGDAVAVAISGLGRRRRRVALLLGAELERAARVVLGEADLALGREVLTGVELGVGELEVRLGHGQLVRRALVGAVLARLAHQILDAAGAAAQIVAGASGGHEGDQAQRRQRKGPAHQKLPAGVGASGGASPGLVRS